MLGNKLWNSLTTDFQLELTVNKSNFVKEGEFDGALLWDFIRRRVNPTTTVGASKMKEELERTTLAKFNGDVVLYNTWFEDKRSQIIGEEGDQRYNEYLRNVFRAYLSSDNEEFLSAIKDEKRKWMQGKLPPAYEYGDLLQIGRVTFNNLDAEEGKDNDNRKSKEEKPEQSKEAKFLAMMTKLTDALGSSASGNEKSESSGREKKRQFQQWRYEKTDNEKTKLVRGTTMRWCTNDCHDKPMWCGRKTCLNKADFAKKMQEKRNGTSGSDSSSKSNGDGKDGDAKISGDFKIALQAMTSSADYKLLEQQFFSGN